MNTQSNVSDAAWEQMGIKARGPSFVRFARAPPDLLWEKRAADVPCACEGH